MSINWVLAEVAPGGSEVTFSTVELEYTDSWSALGLNYPMRNYHTSRYVCFLLIVIKLQWSNVNIGPIMPGFFKFLSHFYDKSDTPCFYILASQSCLNTRMFIIATMEFETTHWLITAVINVTGILYEVEISRLSSWVTLCKFPDQVWRLFPQTCTHIKAWSSGS